MGTGLDLSREVALWDVCGGNWGALLAYTLIYRSSTIWINRRPCLWICEGDIQTIPLLPRKVFLDM